jgi:hypothetical protein
MVFYKFSSMNSMSFNFYEKKFYKMNFCETKVRLQGIKIK